MIEGKKTILQEMLPSDLPAVEAWRNDPEVSQFLPTQYRSAQDLREWFGFTEESPNLAYFIVSTDESQRIGYAGLRDIDWHERTAMLEIVIGEKAFQGLGYGTDAIKMLLSFGFDTLGLGRVFLAVLPYNNRAITAYERCGFRRQGVLKDFVLKDGKLWHPLLMQITKEQFHLKEKLGD